MPDNSQDVNIETIVLVAVWSQPAIFQGCFKLTPADSTRKPIFLFFRCQYENNNETNYGDENFSPDEYHFSHLYNEDRLLPLEQASIGMEYAHYILKYALYKTLLEMRMNQKQKFMSIDDVAMKAMLKKVEPMLQREGAWEISDEHIGFAVAMDFCPHEQMGRMAIETLFNFSCEDNG